MDLALPKPVKLRRCLGHGARIENLDLRFAGLAVRFRPSKTARSAHRLRGIGRAWIMFADA